MDKCDSKWWLLIDGLINQFLFWRMGTELALAFLKEGIRCCSENLSETRKQVIHSSITIHPCSRSTAEAADMWAIFNCLAQVPLMIHQAESPSTGFPWLLAEVCCETTLLYADYMSFDPTCYPFSKGLLLITDFQGNNTERFIISVTASIKQILFS